MGLRWIVPVSLCLAIIASVMLFNNPLQIHQEKMAASFTDRELLKIIDQKNPDPSREMLYKENSGENGILIFTKKLSTEKPGMTWEVGYINSKSQGWNWVSGGETWIDFVTINEYNEGLTKGFKRALIYKYISFKEGAPFPLMFGTTIDPRIAQVRITDDNDVQQMAKVVRDAHRGYSQLNGMLT
ncbi:hypothetical protein [Paenibacillus sp. GP183]|uniref:hypothetical protein n=1 Tax=Paenibacillus sp. GP183 TaxID=1882751 RepID=UPI000898D1A4|nr:hypothetical protein [Paenibacillus sp. GP183]SED12324.1 hypothetical protein SAMN05443246_5808 [Paenibacillus sp. GP183]